MNPAQSFLRACAGCEVANQPLQPIAAKDAAPAERDRYTLKKMKTLVVKLADYLEIDGWDIAENLTDDLEWWADEIWHLKSRWSPVGAAAFVTFLVDPQWHGNRRKGEGVWAIGCSAIFPRDLPEATSGDTLSMRASKEEIEEFIEVIAAFRKLHGNV